MTILADPDTKHSKSALPIPLPTLLTCHQCTTSRCLAVQADSPRLHYGRAGDLEEASKPESRPGIGWQWPHPRAATAAAIAILVPNPPAYKLPSDLFSPQSSRNIDTEPNTRAVTMLPMERNFNPHRSHCCVPDPQRQLHIPHATHPRSLSRISRTNDSSDAIISFPVIPKRQNSND